MTDIGLIASKFFSQLGFDPDSAEFQVLVDAVDYYVSRNITPTEDFSHFSADETVIMAFSFGLGPNNSPGATNKALAAIIKAICEKDSRFPVFAQWEIADALREIGITENFRAVIKNGYLNTEGVLEQFIDEFKRRNTSVKSVIVVAQPDHFYRCRRLVEKQGLTAILPALVPPKPWLSFGCDDWGYDPTSEQDWIRSRPRFLLKELLSLLRTV